MNFISFHFKFTHFTSLWLTNETDEMAQLSTCGNDFTRRPWLDKTFKLEQKVTNSYHFNENWNLIILTCHLHQQLRYLFHESKYLYMLPAHLF